MFVPSLAFRVLSGTLQPLVQRVWNILCSLFKPVRPHPQHNENTPKSTPLPNLSTSSLLLVLFWGRGMLNDPLLHAPPPLLNTTTSRHQWTPGFWPKTPLCRRSTHTHTARCVDPLHQGCQLPLLVVKALFDCREMPWLAHCRFVRACLYACACLHVYLVPLLYLVLSYRVSLSYSLLQDETERWRFVIHTR